MERPIACDTFGCDANRCDGDYEIVDDAHDVSGVTGHDADGS